MADDDFLPILKTSPDSIPERVLVVGDQNRVDKVLGYLNDTEEISHNREYRSAKGTFDDVEVGIVSHGVGSAGAGACPLRCAGLALTAEPPLAAAARPKSVRYGAPR